MKTFVTSALLIVLGFSAHADHTVTLPKPQGGKVSCKSAQRAAFIQEFVTELDILAKQLSTSLASDEKVKEELEATNIAGVKTDVGHLIEVFTSAEVDRNVLILRMGLSMSMAEQSALIRHGFLKRDQEIERKVIIIGADNCIVGL